MNQERSAGERISLDALQVRNFRSLGNVHLSFEPGVSVLVGRNAAGKSNIVDALKFVEDALYDAVNRAVKSRGGRALLHRHGGRTARSFTTTLGFHSAALAAKYEIRIAINGVGDASISSERIVGEMREPDLANIDIYLKQGRFSKPKLSAETEEALPGLVSNPYSLDFPMLSVMGDSPIMARLIAEKLYKKPKIIRGAAQIVNNLSNFIGEMRFYHLFPNVMRSPKQPTGEDTLEENGENLPGVVMRIKRDNSTPYHQLVDALNRVVPDVKDIRVNESGGYHFVQLLHRSLSSNGEEGGWLNLSEESDGTVRVLGLLVALYQEPPPSLIVIEEPELTVHVGALGIVADTINEVAKRCQVVITTHSADILDYFHADSIRVVSNVEGQTRAGKPRPVQLKALKESLLTPGEIHRSEGLSFE